MSDVVKWIEVYDKIEFMPDNLRDINFGEKSTYTKFCVNNILENLRIKNSILSDFNHILSKEYRIPYYNTVLCTDEYSIFITKLYCNNMKIFQPSMHRFDIDESIFYKTILVIEPFISKESLNHILSESVLEFLPEYINPYRIYLLLDKNNILQYINYEIRHDNEYLFEHNLEKFQEFKDNLADNLDIIIYKPLNLVIETLIMFSCKESKETVEIEAQHHLHPTGKILPKYEYRIITIEIPKELTKAYNIESLEHNGIRKRYHTVRGHARYYTEDKPLFGKYTGWVWIAPHVRGDRNLGVIDKDYNVVNNT